MSIITAATGTPSSSRAAAIAASWLGPPVPNAAPGASVTPASPPQPTSTTGASNGAPSRALPRARLATSRPSSRASPSRLVESVTAAEPAAAASSIIASQAP